MLGALKSAIAHNDEARVLALCLSGSVPAHDVACSLPSTALAGNEATAQLLWALAATDACAALIHTLGASEAAYLLPLLASRVPRAYTESYMNALRENAEGIAASGAKIAPCLRGTLLDAAFALGQAGHGSEQALLEHAALAHCTGASLVRAARKTLLRGRLPDLLTAERTVSGIGTVPLAQLVCRWYGRNKTKSGARGQWLRAMVRIAQVPFRPDPVTGHLAHLAGRSVPRLLVPHMAQRHEYVQAALVCAVFDAVPFPQIEHARLTSEMLAEAMELTVELATDATFRPYVARNPARLLLQASGGEADRRKYPAWYRPYSGEVNTWPPLGVAESDDS